MSYIITATAPTAYQLSSLNAFGMGYVKNGNGSFSASMRFESEEEAKSFLEKRAELYNDADPEGTDAKLAIILSDIKNYGTLRLDAVTAYLNEESI